MAQQVVSGVAISVLQEATLPLSGDELVPIVQDGVTRQTTASALGGSAPVDVPEATVQGRALGDGTGPVETLDETQLGDIVWDEFQNSNRRTVEDIGYTTVPQSVIGGGGNFVLSAGNSSTLVRFTTAGAHSVLIPTQAVGNFEDNYVFTVLNVLAGITLTIDSAVPEAVSIINLNDGTEGPVQMVGVGICTLYKVANDQWAVHGSNLVPAP